MTYVYARTQKVYKQSAILFENQNLNKHLQNVCTLKEAHAHEILT